MDKVLGYVPAQDQLDLPMVIEPKAKSGGRIIVYEISPGMVVREYWLYSKPLPAGKLISEE